MGQAPAPSNSMLPCAWRVLAASSPVASSPGRDRVAATSRNTPRATAAHVASAGRGHAQQPPASAAVTAVGRSEVSGAVPVVAGPPPPPPPTPPTARAPPVGGPPAGGRRAGPPRPYAQGRRH